MRVPLIVTFAIALLETVTAQSTYNKLFLTGTSFKFNSIELPSGNLLVGLGCAHGVSRIDHQGNILETQCYMPNPMVRISSIRQVSINSYAYGTSWQTDSCSYSNSFTVPFTHPAIGLMDSLGNVIAYKHYTLGQDCRNATGDILVTQNKGVLAWGSDTSFFALRVDSSLAVVWGKRFNNHGDFQFIKELPGGDLLAGINMDTAGAVVARMDANGNFLWCKSYIRPRGMIHDAVIESDDSFIITGYTDSTTLNVLTPLPSAFEPKLFLMKLNGMGEIQWCQGYFSTPNLWYTPVPSRIVKTLNGQYALLATLGYPQNNFFNRPFLMKTDLNGDTLWTRSLGTSGYDYFTMDLLTYSDGGYVVSGYIWGDIAPASSAAFLYKTDSLGHFPCSEQTPYLERLDLFPVDSTFNLTSVNGSFEQPAYMVDTIFPISTYDACTVTSVYNPSLTSSRKVNIRPNPNTGQFTMEFADSLLRESYYSVYDPLGKLLFQRPLPTGATIEEVDLSRFGKGTYVIKITDPEGIRHERVVLE